MATAPFPISGGGHSSGRLRCACGNVDEPYVGQTIRCLICGQTATVAPDRPAPAGPPAGKVSGEVLGFRVWALQGHELRSVNTALAPWTLGGPNTARCYRSRFQAGSAMLLPSRSPLRPSEIPADDDHPVPSRNCGCGLYAYFDAALSLRAGGGVIGEARDLVGGAIAAWGKLEVHANGFRAEHARIVVLAYYPDQAYRHVQTVQALAGEFDIPVVELEELAEAAAEYGQPVPDELRPASQPAGDFAGYARLPASALASGGRLGGGGSMMHAATIGRPLPVASGFAPVPAGPWPLPTDIEAEYLRGSVRGYRRYAWTNVALGFVNLGWVLVLGQWPWEIINMVAAASSALFAGKWFLAGRRDRRRLRELEP